MFKLTKGELIILITLLFLIISIPMTIYLVKQQQILRSRAEEGNALLQIVDEGGNPITSTSSRNVKLKITFSPPAASTAPSTSPLPSTSGAGSTDNDNDGDPNSTDCGPNDPRANHSQTGYFATSYTSSSGQSSFDFNCDGQASKEFPLYGTRDTYWFYSPSVTTCSSGSVAAGVAFRADFACGATVAFAGNGTSACRQAKYGPAPAIGSTTIPSGPCTGDAYWDGGGCTEATPTAVACR